MLSTTWFIFFFISWSSWFYVLSEVNVVQCRTASLKLWMETHWTSGKNWGKIKELIVVESCSSAAARAYQKWRENPKLSPWRPRPSIPLHSFVRFDLGVFPDSSFTVRSLWVEHVRCEPKVRLHGWHWITNASVPVFIVLTCFLQSAVLGFINW